MNTEEAITLINHYGKEGTPFFLMTDFDLKKIKVLPLSELSGELLYVMPSYQNHTYHKIPTTDLSLKVDPYSFKHYYQEFEKVKDELAYGNSFLINLTSRNRIETKATISEIFNNAEAKYKLYYKGDNQHMVVFSPETFVSIKDKKISSYPMKGTIDAQLPNAKDLLLKNEKELAEHYTIVDLIRNDLSIYAKNVTVEKFRYLDLIKSNNKDLYQVSSEITGDLPKNYPEILGDIIFSMLPAGSISGAPKTKTVDIINSVEPCNRGYYTGIAGAFDGQNFESFVMIRYIEEVNGHLYYRSGGGITFQSEVEVEYQEMIDKIYIPNA